MTAPRRPHNRDQMIRTIKQIARQQMAEQGTDCLSLRGIARTLGMTPPALYRYFDSRDALVTALIADAFASLSHALQDAHTTAGEQGRLMALCLAYRQWALAHPGDYLLIFTNGSLLPFASAPPEIASDAARAGFKCLIETIALTPQEPVSLPPLPPAMVERLAFVRAGGYYGDVPLSVLYMGLALWARAHGLVMLELFNQSPRVVGDPGVFYRYEMEVACRGLGLQAG